MELWHIRYDGDVQDGIMSCVRNLFIPFCFVSSAFFFSGEYVNYLVSWGIYMFIVLAGGTRRDFKVFPA